MTTGNVIYDAQFDYPLDCGVAKLGTKSQKIWSGGNGSTSEEHPYEMVFEVDKEDWIVWYFKTNGNAQYVGTWKSCFGDLNIELLVDSLSPADEYKLINKAANQFRRHEFNGAVNLGELKESVKMIGDIARSLARCYVNLKRGNAAGALNALGIQTKSSRVREVQRNLRDSAASAWLGLAYGVRPALGAVEDAAKAAASNLIPRKARVVSRVGKSSSTSADLLGGGVGLVGGRRSVNLIWNIEEIPEFSTLDEFGFNSLSLVAYELTTLSFVADWFIPIGNFLEARSNLSLLTGTYTRTELTQCSVECGPQELDAHVVLSGKRVQQYTKIERTTGAIGQMPLPRPRFKNPWSASHATSGIALLQSILLSKRS